MTSDGVPEKHLRANTESLEAPVLVNEGTGPTAMPVERLVCVVGPDMGKTFMLTNHPLVIGRGEVDFVLQSGDVSRSHARFLPQDEQTLVEDLSSANGTYVNGKRIGKPTELQYGDRLQLGSTILVFTRHDELENKLQQIQKLEAMAAMVKGIGHDFNNMLTVVQAGLDDLADRIPANDALARATLDDMVTATTSAAATVRRLLRLGRNKPPTSEIIRIDALIAETVTMVRRLKLDRIEVSTDVPPDTVVDGSREDLRNVLMNLILNARDAMPDGGRITIAVAVLELERAAALAKHLGAEGTYVQITVRDTGAGMDEATLERIFEPFFTTKAPGKGNGLGLAMVFSTVRNHRGAVSVESARGRGTTFRMLIPAATL